MKVHLPGIASQLIPAFSKLGMILLLSVPFLPGCQKADDPDLNAVDMELFAEDFVSPIQVASSHNSQRLYVVDQVGKIWVVDRNGYKRPTPFLDISSKLVSLNPDYDERGLLGVAFHEGFKTNGRFFVYYQLPPRAGGPVPGATWNNLSRVSEFNVIAEQQRADPNSEKVIL